MRSTLREDSVSPTPTIRQLRAPVGADLDGERVALLGGLLELHRDLQPLAVGGRRTHDPRNRCR